MTTSGRSLAEILRDVNHSIALLEGADRDWPDALGAELPGRDVPEVSRIEDLLHAATHETATTLALTLQDVEVLLQRVRLRRKFSTFSAAQLERIVREGWSTRLAADMRTEFPSMTLAELSAHMKELCTDWEKLPKLASADDQQ
jgi:hypothetical protein